MPSLRQPLFLAVLAAGLLMLGAASAFPGANGRIAFVRGGEIWTLKGMQLTDLNVAGDQPAFSPTGQRIVFVQGGELWTMNPDGSGAASLDVVGTDPAWSADGAQIAFERGGEVRRVNADGTGDTLVATGAAPAWSPDGTLIAFVRGQDVWTITVSGAAESNLTASVGNSAPAWSPDGSRIAFTSTRDGNSELYVMAADGTAQTRLTATAAIAEASPTWSPDGDRIAFTRSDGGGNLWRIPAAGGAQEQLTTDGAGDTSPDWGTSLAATVAPTVSGAAVDGTILTVTNGTWVGDNAVTSFAYGWKRCTAAGTGCVTIPNATSNAYELTSQDVGFTIRGTVHATSADGTAAADSAPTALVTASAPANEALPSISGTPTIGTTSTADEGDWAGTTPLTFSFQWRRCNSSGDNCADIGGATARTYPVTSADAGSRLRVIVTASNAVGNASATSAASSLVAAASPTNNTAPTINGTRRAGSLLSATVGSWTGVAPIDFDFQWRRCDAAGGNCTNISGATVQSYSVTAIDVGTRLQVEVTATNSAGTATALSAITDVIAPDDSLVNVTRPAISGAARVGSTLVASPGTWRGGRTPDLEYQWRRCRGTLCTDIDAARSASYTVVAADLGQTLVVEVTADDGDDEITATSPPTAVVTAAAVRPRSAAAPRVSGRAVLGVLLRANVGRWTGTRPFRYRYAWQRCNARGARCATIRGAARATYRLKRADVSRRVRVVITATNAAASVSRASRVSAVVKRR